MTSPSAARTEAVDRSRRWSFEPVMTFTSDGLVLGNTVLAPLRDDRDGAPEVAIDGAEERILVLLAVAYGRTARAGILGNVRRAARYWHQGENDLAAIEIALGGLPPLADEKKASARLSLGDQLLVEGLTPRELMKAGGLDPASLDFLKAGYNPDQPRVPAGNPDGGQWTATGDDKSPDSAGEASVPGVTRIDPNIEFVSYTPVHGLPDDAVVVTTPDGKTIADPDSKTKKLMAPPRADYREVYAAGRAIARLSLLSQIPAIRSAVGQGGTYDYQRDPVTGFFHDAYTNASNYAVGVFMAGAGHSLYATEITAESYAFLFSSNFGSPKTIKWIERGWHDAISDDRK